MAVYKDDNYQGGTQQNLTTTFKSLLSMLGAASSPRRGMLYYFMLVADGTPSVQNNDIMDVASQTADDGTKTNVTPAKRNPADAAATTLSRANFTVEGTIGAGGFLQKAFNQLIAYEWRADDGDELIWAATANTGYVIRSKGQTAGYTSTIFVEDAFVEL